ncbi:ABC transporter substrate-binding protein [Paenibacillus eucommiae]|uniref:ABC-type glycerol-3-phosphate transport system substrate-binding protein n=1 Tax=Paenibacillus eucommiae TaxID=1355755 RepID=A0ABS4ILR4_9BACL|nr:extracellular solute-binding protein [Paenibacillus eucommiae]MBP1988453.1 ABC-type glycerol-3-phosphate transport system substrate-binding protein [Paenibacillus eucommiae]
MKGKSLVLLLTIVLAGLLVVTACSKTNSTEESTSPEGTQQAEKTAAPEAPPKEEENRDPVTLKLLSWHVGATQELFDLFHEKYPWITIQAEEWGVDKAVAMQAAGDPADLVWIAGLTPWLKDGMLEDLTPYIAKDPNIQNAKIIDGFVDAFKTPDGKTFAIPYTFISEWMVVNKDLLKKHGMEMPSYDWTYDDMLEMAKKATDPAANEYGLSYDSLFSSHFNWMLPVANGNAANLRFFNEDLSQSVFNTPGVQADLKWLQELTTKWHVKPTDEEAAKLGWEQANNFLTGKVLFTLGADWVVPGYNELATFDWDILPVPRGKEKQVTAQLLGPIGILSASKHKDAAYKWISFQFEMEAQKWHIKNGSNAFVIHPDLDAELEKTPTWQGKDLEVLKMSKNMCCFLLDPIIPDLDNFNATVDDPLFRAMTKDFDITSLVPLVDKFNENSPKLRKDLGW